LEGAAHQHNDHKGHEASNNLRRNHCPFREKKRKESKKRKIKKKEKRKERFENFFFFFFLITFHSDDLTSLLTL